MRIGFAVLLVALLFTVPGETGVQDQVTIRPPNPNAPLSPVGSDGEYQAVLNIQDERDPSRRMRLIADFERDYFDSEFRHLVMRLRWQAMTQRGDDPEDIIEAAQTALAAEDHFFNGKMGFNPQVSEEELNRVVFDLTNQKALYYGSMADAYQSLGDAENALRTSEFGLNAVEDSWNLFVKLNEEGTEDFEAGRSNVNLMRLNFLKLLVPAYQAAGDAEKVVEYGRRLLDVAPDDLEMLMTVSSVMAQRPPQNAAARAEHLTAAEGYAAKAIELADEFLDGPGSRLADAQKASIRSGTRTTLGMVHLQQGKFEDAIDEYEEALDAVGNDPNTYYMLGIAYNNTQNVDGAVESLARAIALGFNQPQARQMLETAYRAKNGSLDGLDDYIESQDVND